MTLAERETVVDGTVFRYLMGGDGPPLVMVHGFLGSAENFAGWWDELAEEHTLVIPDLPGCGRSGILGGPHTSSALAASLVRFCTSLGIARADLLGLCLGSGVALGMTRSSDLVVGQLVLHTPLLAPDLVHKKFHLQARVMTAPVVFPLIRWAGHQRWVSDLYKRLVVEGDNVDQQVALVNFENQMAAYPRAVREWVRDGLALDQRALLAARDTPTLVLLGQDDAICNVPRLARELSAMPMVQLDVYAGSGHGWTAEYVAHQASVIKAFLHGADEPAFSTGGSR